MKGGNVINTVAVYGVARTDEDGNTVLEYELYADEMLAQAACRRSQGLDSMHGPAVVWPFVLVRNCVKSNQDAEEFFKDRDDASTELLLTTFDAEPPPPRDQVSLQA